MDVLKLSGGCLDPATGGIVNTVSRIKGSQTGRKGGKTRAANDPKTEMIREITVEYEKSKHLFYLYGRTTKFINRMSDEYPQLAYGSISNLVTKLKKKDKLS